MASTSFCDCMKMIVALIGIATAINGMETQFNEPLVEVEREKGNGWCHQNTMESLIFS